MLQKFFTDMISIIIPALNESEQLPGLLQQLAEEEVSHEVIVVDGGSTDSTISVASSFGAKVIRSLPGRGIQLAAGFEASKGEVLFFLHADTKIHRTGLESLSALLENRRDIVGGNFRVLYDHECLFCRFVEKLVSFIRKFGLYYGDSGIFARRAVYEKIGGMRQIEIMEDLDFALRLENFGKTYCIDSAPLITSTRRFHRMSGPRLIMLWLSMHVLFFLGVPNKKLALIYGAKNTSSLNLDT